MGGSHATDSAIPTGLVNGYGEAVPWNTIPKESITKPVLINGEFEVLYRF